MRIAIVALISLTFIALLAACGGDSDEASTEVVKTPTPGATAPTEEPTASPAPEPTDSSSGALFDEIRYAIDAGAILDDFALLSGNLSDLMGQVADDPIVVLGEQWIADLNQVQRRLDDAQRELLALNPPLRFRESHSLLVQAFSEMDTAMDFIEVGARDINADLIAEGTAHIIEATGLFEEATAAMPEAE